MSTVIDPQAIEQDAIEQGEPPAPPRLGLLSLSLDLYRKVVPEALATYCASHAQRVEVLGRYGEVVGHDLCCNREEVERTVARIQAAGADVLVVVLQSYSLSLASLPALLRTPLPLVIWNTQDLGSIDDGFDADRMMANHGMHGVQDLCSCLRRTGRTFGLVSGHWRNEAHLAELADWLKAAHGVALSRRMKVGLMGRPFAGMGDFTFDEVGLISRWGPAVEPLTLAELAEAQARIGEAELAAEIEADRERFAVEPDVTDEDHRRSARLAIALRRVVEAHGVDAFTMHFGVFGEDPRIETCPFLGVNHLIAAGRGYAGDGDATMAALDGLLGRLYGPAGFCEMFTADFEHNQVFMSHMGEGNYRLARPGERPVLRKVPYTFGKGRPFLVPLFRYAPGPTTLVNVAVRGDGRFGLIAFEADVLDFNLGERYDSPHFKIAVKGELGPLLDRYSRAGGTHHLTRIPGRRLDSVERLAHMLEMEFTRI